MRYSPYPAEINAVSDMNDAQLLEYFLTRVYETEEVWGLDDGCEWVMVERDGQATLAIWPYRHFALEAARQHWQDVEPTAESLEDFVYETLGMLMNDDSMLLVMGSSPERGCLVSPHRLYDIFTGMMNSGEYVLDS